MKKGTKFTTLGKLTREGGGSLANVDYKFKMGFKPIVSPAKRS